MSRSSSQHRLAFLTGRMIDHRHRPASGSPTRSTRRPQLTVSDLAGERHITLPIPQGLGFVEQRRRPKMWILGQPLTHISLDHLERIRLRRPPLPRHPLTRKVSSYCSSVSSQMPGNSPHRPSPFPQRVYSPRTPPVPTSAVGPPSPRCQISHQQLGEDPTQRLVFAVTRWGCSVIETG